MLLELSFEVVCHAEDGSKPVEALFDSNHQGLRLRARLKTLAGEDVERPRHQVHRR